MRRLWITLSYSAISPATHTSAAACRWSSASTPLWVSSPAAAASSMLGDTPMPPVLVPLGPGQDDGRPVGVDRRRVGRPPHLDVHVAPLLVGVHHQLVLRLLATEELLGQRRPVVGRVRLAGDDDDRSVAPGLAVLLSSHPAGKPSADDHVVIARHRASSYSHRNVRSDTTASAAVTTNSIARSGSTSTSPWPRTMVSRRPFAR